jgi:hypothetical protein
MDLIRPVKFDIHGTEPVNTVVGEVIALTDKTCPWVLPNGAPFFAEPALVTVYDQRGAVMVLDRDYFLEEEFVPFCEVTGRSIKTFIRLPQNILDANSQVSVDYQSIGAYFVPRNDLVNWMDQIQNGKRPLTWDKVFNMPPTLPSSLHSHSIKTEITDWYELTWFFVYLEKLSSSRDPAANDKVTAASRLAFDRLKTGKTTRLNQLKAHDENYNVPHQTTKFDITMGNHDNFATATLAEELAGIRSDVFSTPMGVGQLAKSYKADTDAAMFQGIMPLSRFAGDSYIPPNIDGSFEGLGALYDTSGFCMENSGMLMMLTNHYDGRQQGLYYSYVENYDQPAGKIIYTGYKYAPASLVALGINPTAIIAGSNGKAMMVGNPATPDWFVCLTNGTFDPSAHRYVRVDMTAVNALFAGAPWVNNNRATIHHMGDYLVLVQNYGTAYADNYAFFRVKVSDIQSGLAVAWQLLKVTYTDWDGTPFTNASYVQPNATTKDGNNTIIKYGPWSFRQPIATLSKSGRTMVVSCPKPGVPNVNYIHIMPGFAAIYTAPGVNINITLMTDIGWELNCVTGVMTQIAKLPALSVGFTDSTPAERSGYMDLYLTNFYNATFQSSNASTVILDNGDVVTSTIQDGNIFPSVAEVSRYKNKTSDASLLSGRLDLQAIQLSFRRILKPVLKSPILNGTYPGSVTYTADSEIFGAVEQSSGTRKIYTRLVTGGYQVRPGVNNLSIGDIFSRPLTGAVYETNLGHNDLTIGMTGSAAELAAGGVECGSTSFSACGWASYSSANQTFPRNTLFKAPAGNNVLISFPRTVTRTLDPGLKKATYAADSFYGIRQNIIDKLKAMIPAVFQSTKYWGFSLNVLGSEAGGMFNGLNIGIALIYFFDATLSQTRTQVVLFTPVVETPNADHPGVFWIKDITVLDAPPHVRTCVNVKMADANLLLATALKQKALLTAYRDNGKLKVYVMGPFSTVTTQTINTKQLCLFDIDLVTNKVTGVYGGSSSWTQGDIVTMLPKIGMADVTLAGNTPDSTSISAGNPQPYMLTGGAGALIKKTNPDNSLDYYLVASAYPETGWTLFLQDNIRMLVNGTAYAMEGGTIDLRDIDPAPQNKTFYIYATVQDDKPRYLVTEVKMRKSGNMLKAATVVTNSQQILSITRHQPLMVGQYQLSYTREGGIIPVSTGFPQDEGTFAFLHNAELLP